MTLLNTIVRLYCSAHLLTVLVAPVFSQGTVVGLKSKSITSVLILPCGTQEQASHWRDLPGARSCITHREIFRKPVVYVRPYRARPSRFVDTLNRSFSLWMTCHPTQESMSRFVFGTWLLAIRSKLRRLAR